MEAIEIARKMAALGEIKDARQAYYYVLERGEQDPIIRLESAIYLLENGWDHRLPYTVFLELYAKGYFRDYILPLVTEVFYTPNIKLLKGRYERNVKLLGKYPYFFCKKPFPEFEELPIKFYPFDDHNGYVPYFSGEDRFGDFVNVKDNVISRNFFKDLERPVLASDVFSQYELEYLNDNVRRSEDVARENHIYLHYSSWMVFCSWLQVLNLRPLVEKEKAVFLIEEEIEQYPIDFKERFDIDYSKFKVQPVRIQEINRMIWHTQLSTHNGGDFFNEVFDAHPNLLAFPSMMFYNIEENIKTIRDALKKCVSLQSAMEAFKAWNAPRVVEELFHMREPSDKDLLVAMYMTEKDWMKGVDRDSRIAPAIFFQPHFHNIVYNLSVDKRDRTVLWAENVEQLHKSPIFKGFKYIKTFTPMRRFTNSHAATVRFMYDSALERNKELEKNADAEDKTKGVVSDAVSERVLNRSFMIDPEDRLYHDSVLVRFEDGKLNPRATFSALAAFLDLPYTESMTRCSEMGEVVPYLDGGFSAETVYRTYEDFANDSERTYIEYFLRDAYEFYGYDFNYYDGRPMDEEGVNALISNFTTIDHYMRDTWIAVFQDAKVSVESAELSTDVEGAIQQGLLERYMSQFHENRIRNTKNLMRGLHFINRNGQPLYMMPKLELDPALLERPLYH